MKSIASRSRALAFERHCWNLEFMTPIAPLIAALGYLALVADLSLVEWGCLAACFAVYTIVAGFARTRNSGGRAQQIQAFLAQRDANGRVADAETGSVWRDVLALPFEMQRARFASLLGLGVATPCLMTLAGFSGWFQAPLLQSFALVLLVCAIVSSGLQFYWARSAFRGFRNEIGGDLDASSTSSAHASMAPVEVERLSLTRAMQLAILVPVSTCLLLSLNVVAESQRERAESDAIAWIEVALETLAESRSEGDLEERVAAQNRQRAAWPVPVELFIYPPDRTDRRDRTPYSDRLLQALDLALAGEESSGLLRAAHAVELAVFERVGPETFVVGAVERAQLAPSIFGIDARVGLALAGLLAWIWGLARLVSRDLHDSIGALRAATVDLVVGNGASSAVFETGDDLGDLGRTVYRVGSELRATNARVEQALDQVERTAALSMTIASELVASSAEQSERLQHAMDLIVSIDARGCEVSQSAEALNESVDESSSSIAELGAAGAELNQTASVLSSKVDEVSNSMEQMVRSVKQVGATTEKLAGASEDTSSSMEEMASAMRVVDTSAESMARLSLDVVAKAEIGQAKVCQTIEGMEAIREATDAAERVIRGLGSRTLEIGGILDVIDDVADETNLLALNAAIIAAQAGEQGKAFSVVADEIKELADRVLASTKEIGGLIRSVQEESENAIGAIEAGSQSVMSGVDLSAEAGRTLEEITDASRQNGARIGEIVASVREQTKAAGHVVLLMEKVRDSADEISTASSEQDRGNEVIYRSALTMREVAQQVRRTTEEQSLGFGRIRDSVEGVRNTAERITRTLRDQAGACGEASSFLQQVCDGTRANEQAFSRLEGAMKELLAQAEALRTDVSRSQIS